MTTLAWKKNTFPLVSSLIGCTFSILQKKNYETNPSEMDIKVLVPAPKQWILLQTKDQKFHHNGKVLMNSSG